MNYMSGVHHLGYPVPSTNDSAKPPSSSMSSATGAGHHSIASTSSGEGTNNSNVNSTPMNMSDFPFFNGNFDSLLVGGGGGGTAAGDNESESVTFDGDDASVVSPTSKKRKADSESSTAPGEVRKLKNRINAKKARLKKKNFIATLEESVRELKEENMKFRKFIASRSGRDPNDVLKIDAESASASKSSSSKARDNEEEHNSDESRSNSSGTKTSLSCMSDLMENCVAPMDMFFLKSLQDHKQSFVLTNPNLVDDPIIFCSEDFCELTGYQKHEILGRNCRFLQGPQSDRNILRDMKTNIQEGKPVVTCIKNYKKNGLPFWNYLSISPIKDAVGNTIMRVGVQYVIDEATAVESLMKQSASNSSTM